MNLGAPVVSQLDKYAYMGGIVPMFETYLESKMGEIKKSRMEESVTVNGKPLAQYMGKIEKAKPLRRPKRKKYDRTKKPVRSSSKPESSMTWMRENALRGTGINTSSKRTRRRGPFK